MAVEVKWGDPAQETIHLKFQPDWAWDDLYAAISQADHFITSVSHTVNLIIDIREAGGLPKDFMAAAREIFAQGEARPNEGAKVIVGAKWFIRAAYQGFLAVYGHKLENRPFLFAASMEEAQALLKNTSPDAPH